MGYDLCLLKQANKPYFIENVRINIYSIEELCFYFYHNMCLIDETIINEKLCDWIRDELGLSKMYRQLYEYLEKKDSVVFFISAVFREAGYLTAQELRDYQEQLARLEVQSEDMRQKLRGDYLVREKMYARAVGEYRQILSRRNPGKLGIQFYAGIWNNLGAAYAGLFQFEEAAQCFWESYRLMKTKETFRKYISALPLFLPEEAYQKRLEELQADTYLVSKIQEYNAKVCTQPQFQEMAAQMKMRDLTEVLEELKEDYCRSTKI